MNLGGSSCYPATNRLPTPEPATLGLFTIGSLDHLAVRRIGLRCAIGTSDSFAHNHNPLSCHARVAVSRKCWGISGQCFVVFVCQSLKIEPFVLVMNLAEQRRGKLV